MEKHKKEALEFLAICKEFRLGKLPTESPHPKTLELSNHAKNNLPAAIQSIKAIDQDVFYKVKELELNIKHLQVEINETIKSGSRVFLCGCGATGRLSLALETIWKIKHQKNKKLGEQVISFMAGGDVALIHSVEKFEDFPEFGERQLLELGFREGDLLISCTEGGETPFVIGATEAATRISSRAPYFLYCNPDDILNITAERSRSIIANDKIKKINLTVGPMALTGSTRMQATTVLMYFVGLALWFSEESFSEVQKEIERIISFIQETDFDFLEKFIKREAEIYERSEYLFYEADRDLGISILTDTTERSPTFSLYPFENQNDEIKKPSLSYLLFTKAKNKEEAWFELLQRDPRTFYWTEVTQETSHERLMGFDFSSQLINHRKKYLDVIHHHFKISLDKEKNTLSFSLDELNHTIPLNSLSFLSTHLVLKIFLNSHSTILMGRLNRYESNLMTWVRASNFKLIDRTVRYASHLLELKGVIVNYDELVHACFHLKDKTPRDESLVLRIVEEFKKV
jgi:N-acetylmuramic acid 6-phosphate etherase